VIEASQESPPPLRRITSSAAQGGAARGSYDHLWLVV